MIPIVIITLIAGFILGFTAAVLIGLQINRRRRRQFNREIDEIIHQVDKERNE